MELDSNPGINVGALARSLSKDQASTSILIDKLMSMGLVRRETDPADRRRARLFITAQARDFVDRLERSRDDINRLVLDALGASRSRELETLLSDFLDQIEGSEAGPSADGKRSG
jgi:DNA-binding MarR family transcriptional regulator